MSNPVEVACGNPSLIPGQEVGLNIPYPLYPSQLHEVGRDAYSRVWEEALEVVEEELYEIGVSLRRREQYE